MKVDDDAVQSATVTTGNASPVCNIAPWNKGHFLSLGDSEQVVRY
jgi:hypothetical protein